MDVRRESKTALWCSRSELWMNRELCDDPLSVHWKEVENYKTRVWRGISVCSGNREAPSVLNKNIHSTHTHNAEGGVSNDEKECLMHKKQSTVLNWWGEIRERSSWFRNRLIQQLRFKAREDDWEMSFSFWPASSSPTQPGLRMTTGFCSRAKKKNRTEIILTDTAFAIWVVTFFFFFFCV